MAKNENKKENKPIEDVQPKITAMPEKTEMPVKSDASEAIKKAESTPKKEKTSEPKKVKSGGWGKFVFFIFLCLLGGLAFFVLQLEQTKKQNAETLDKLQTAYEEKLTVVASKVNVLDREVAALKDRPIVEQVAGVSENTVNQKIAALRNELENRLVQLSENKSVAESESKESDVSEKESESKALLAPEVVSLAAAEKKTQEVLLASGAIIVRDLAEQGVSFAYEAEVLQILARGNELAENYVRTVRTFANVGISGKNQLIRNFDKVFAELNNTQTKFESTEKTVSDTEKWYEKAWLWLKKTIVIKKGQEKPVFTVESDEVYDLVHEGRFQDALNAMKISEKYAKVDSKPLNEWHLQVSRYIQFNNAISGLIMNALANIHLKEMEHAAQ